MIMNLTDARKLVVFSNSKDKFRKNFDSLMSGASKMISDNKKEDAAKLISEIAIDLQSRLADWVLKHTVDETEINEAVEECYEFLRTNQKEGVIDEIRKEAHSIEQSEIVKACTASDKGEMGFFWGHDYCTGIDYSLRRGACFVTTNPAKINLYRLDNPDEWNEKLKNVTIKNPKISPEETISRMYVEVVAMIAEKLRPIYDASCGKYGFVCIQPNPKTTRDSKAMVDEVLFWNSEFQERFNDKNINIVYKIPAVPAGVEVVRTLKKHGLRLCITLNFSVFQHDLFSDYISGGERGDFLVVMGGIVDDHVAKELMKQGVNEEHAREYSHYAAGAVIRNSYMNLRKKGLNPIIMGGSVRGPWSILNCFTSDASRPIALTTMPDMVKLFDEEPRPISDTVNSAIPEKVLEILEKSKTFKEASRKDGLTSETIEQYPPLVAVNDSFIKGYEETLASLT
ncbi:MAG: transaldolase family protein [Acetivibrionales bacterium]|jgi:hypothetical protein